jgi:predicted esterase
MRTRIIGMAIGLLVLPFAAPAQRQDKAKILMPDEATRAALTEKAGRLTEAIAALRLGGVAADVVTELEVYAKAAEWVTRHNEFFEKDSPPATVAAVLDRGLERAKQAGTGEPPWRTRTGTWVVRAYHSKVDGSVQPYAVALPAAYGQDPAKSWRLDVVLHGRDATLTEVKFLNAHRGDKPVPDQDYVQLEVFGRGNNAYRWAGEADVLDAVEAFRAGERAAGREKLLDPRRVVLRGFSMGGAGAWHLGLRRPDRWAVIGPGAGFSSTHGYLKGLPEKLPSYLEGPLGIYDAVDYAENAFDVPVVAYAGSKDPQLQAAKTVQAALKPLGVPMTLLVGTDLEHKMPPEWQQLAEAEYRKYAGPGQGRPAYPERVRFVTRTLKTNVCDWVELLALARHYEPTRVEAVRTANGFSVMTANVTALRLTPPPTALFAQTVKIDGQEVAAKPTGGKVELILRDGRWQAGTVPDGRRKSPGLQGPIDDAFTGPFLCVRGTGQPWHAAAAAYAAADLARFQNEWNKYLRGELPVKDDTAVTDEDVRDKNLILFGDPSSNAVLARALTGLPLEWTRARIALGGKTFDPAKHVPVLICPNPLNPKRYVVVNSGHTFHAADFQGTNALLYPRLGDYAVLELAPTKDPLAATVATAGLFDEAWK